MKTLLAVLLFLSFNVFASDRAARIESARSQLQAEVGVKDKVVVEDTGKDIDLGAGDGPLVIIKLPRIGRECLVALHPTDHKLAAGLGCQEVPPLKDI